MAISDCISSATFSSLLLTLGIALIASTVYQLQVIQSQFVAALASHIQIVQNTIQEQQAQLKSAPIVNANQQRPIAWISGHGQNPEATYLSHVVEVFKMLGYNVVSGEQPVDAQWNVLWAHEYPFTVDKYRHHIAASSPFQVINHVIGSGFYTSKVALATAGISQGIPQAFQLPEEKDKFLSFAKANPSLLWVQKDNTHRNIVIKLLDELDLDKAESFVQRFVDKPFLIDNRKFDVGIYTVVTSLQPLRVYVYDEALLRFCPQDYTPFDIRNVDKYVVGDDYTPIWEQYYNKQKLNFKSTLNAYVHSIGKDPSLIWTRIRNTIAEQDKMIQVQAQQQFKARFFELSRFDFILDDELNVYLMEANMSPNLSSGHFKPNQLLYEQVLQSILSLVGVGNQLLQDAAFYLKSRPGEFNSEVSDRDISVGLPQCFDDQKCADCKDENHEREILRETYREHLAKRKMIPLNFAPFKAAKIAGVLVPLGREQVYLLFGLSCLFCWLVFNLWILRDYFLPSCFAPVYTETGLNRSKLRKITKQYRMSNAFSISAGVTVPPASSRIDSESQLYLDHFVV